MARLSDLFEVRYGHSLELNRLVRVEPGKGVAFVSRQMGNNGISAWVKPVADALPGQPGELTCALSGNGVLTTHLQEQAYYTAFHVARLIPLVPMSKPQLLYYSMCIKANRYRYSYGRQANRSLKALEIPDLGSLPDFVSGTEVDRYGGRDARADEAPPPLLDISGWRPFALGSIFRIAKGKRLTKADMTPGSTAFVSALDWNNGLRQRISAEPLHPAGVLTVNYNGNGVAEAFYQPEPFFASDDVNVLYPSFQMSVEAALFICTVIRLEKYRFSYGRKWNLERMKESVIRLPATVEGLPDAVAMSRYVRRLPYSSAALEGVGKQILQTVPA